MSLSAEHVADLHASGITAETIAICGFAAIRPQEIKLRGVTSAYRLTYFDLEGKPNCAERWKLFPAISTPTGKQKYHQATGTAPSLYMPPLFSWKTVAKDSRTLLVFTEGEKKAASACQRGLFAAGVAGVWNWRQRLDSGEPLTLPILDQFIWKDRTVELVPDSDAWREDKLLNVLGGFYALGQELISRGATVRLVRLPERAGVKVGLDDWLVAVSDLWETEWVALERVSLDDPRLAPVAAWWQRWREKQATHVALQAGDQETLDFQEAAGLYTVHSAKHAATFTFDRLHDRANTTNAELSITLGSTVVLDAVDINLKSDSAQAKLATTLKTFSTQPPWKLLLQRACALVLRHKRLGRPPLVLSRHTAVTPLTYALNPLVFKKKPTILYGDGGLGKSTLALWCAMLVSTGQQLAGLSALRGRALYLDWEDDEEVHTRRLHALIAGHPELTEAQVDYQQCEEPLPRLLHPLVRRIQADGITFVVVDSLLAASGGDASSEAVSKFFDAIAALKTEALLIGHIAKAPIEGQEQTVYGSVFNKNRARSTWELKRQQEIGDDVSILGLFNRKSNQSRLHQPLGLQVTQDEHGTRIQYEPCELTEAVELISALPLPSRIRNLLESDGMPRSTKQIADELGAKHETVKATLSKKAYSGTKWHRVGENQWTILTR